MGHLCTPYVGSWGASSHLSHILVSVHPLSQSVGWLLLDRIFLDICHASCCCTFICSFIMSQASTSTAMTTTPPLTLVSSGLSSLLLVTVAPSLTRLPLTLGQSGVVLAPRCTGGVIGLVTVSQQQPPSPMPLQAYTNYAMCSPWVGFFFRVKSPTVLYIKSGVCSGVCFLLSGAMMDAIFTYGGSTIGVCTLATLWSLPMTGICATWWWSSAHMGYAQSGCSLHYLEQGGLLSITWISNTGKWQIYLKPKILDLPNILYIPISS